MINKLHNEEASQPDKPKQLHTLILVIQGAAVGILAGLIIVLYRLLLTHAETYLYKALAYCKGHPGRIVLWFVLLLIMAAVVTVIMRLEPMAAGGGLPQVEAELQGQVQPVWWRVLLARLSSGTICILGGLSLGRAAPSIQLGAMAAKGFAKTTHADKNRELHLLACGAGAGLAATFHAPLAGILFVLEEMYHTFDKVLVLAGIVAALTADFVAKLFLGQAPIFSYPSADIPLQFYWVFVLLGIVLGLFGVGYNIIMVKGQAVFGKLHKIPQVIRVAIPFLLAGILGMTLPEVLAGGHAMQVILEETSPALSMLLLLLVMKFVLSVISASSGAPGGIFFPILIMGSYIGAIFGEIMMMCLPLSGDIQAQCIILAMAGFFAAIIRSPITGIILVVEMTGSMHSLLDIALVSIVAYAVANLTKVPPIFDSMLESFLRKQKPNGQK